MGTDQAKRRVSFTLSFRSHARLISPRFRCRLRSYRLCDESAADEYYSQNPIPSIAYSVYDAGHKPLVQPPPPPAGTTTMLTLASNMISAKKNTCSNMATDATQVTLLIDYNFARKLDYRRWLRRWSCVRAALQSQRRRRRGTPQPVCRRPIARKSTFFPKPKRQIFVWRLCWLLLLGITIQFSHAIW